MNSVVHGLKGLIRFKGRDPRGLFWPYAAVVVVVAMIAMGAIMIPEINASFDRMARYVAENPGSGSVTYSTSGAEVAVEGYHPELMPDFGKLFGGMRIVIAGLFVLLAAAVTRRLHDTGRSGLWGLPPIILLASATVLFPFAMDAMMVGEHPDLRPFFLAFANNVLYLAALGLLIVFLILPGKKDANRYGPPSA